MCGLLKGFIAANSLVTAFTASTFQFDGARFPETSVDKHNAYSSRTAEIDGVKVDVTFENIIRTGDVVNNVTFGMLVDINGGPIRSIACVKSASQVCVASKAQRRSLATTCQSKICSTLSNQEQSHDTDYSSFIVVPGTDRVRVMTHFEASTGMMSMFEMVLDQNSCQIKDVQKLSNIDWSESHGLWNPCAGSVSPWGTHLGSEEYEPEARFLSKDPTFYSEKTSEMVNNTLNTLDTIGELYPVLEFIRYFGVYPEQVDSIKDITNVFKPYRYGYATEVTSTDGIKSIASKKWAIGRRAWEMLLVMPDRKTAYGTDDGSCGLLSRFVSKDVDDLSEGTLYAAKLIQTVIPPTDPYQAGEFTIEWIDLGYATDAQVREGANTLDFTDIFDVEHPKDTIPHCSSTFTSSNTNAQECLRVKPGMEIMASRLETRRYAAMLGATVELNKMEGISIDIANNRLYMGISSVDNGMLDEPLNADKGGNAQIAVPKNQCGCVYSMAMDANYVATSMVAAVCGRPSNLDPNNRCDINGISSPDNIWYDNKYELLFIAEDTSYHQNDVMWQFNAETGELTRTLTSPYGAEITSTEFHHFGKCDIFEAVFQHPYGETDEDKLLEVGNSGAGAYLSYMRMPMNQAEATTATPSTSSSSRLGFSLLLGVFVTIFGFYI